MTKDFLQELTQRKQQLDALRAQSKNTAQIILSASEGRAGEAYLVSHDVAIGFRSGDGLEVDFEFRDGSRLHFNGDEVREV